jgi:hypothetical protein
MQRVRPGACEFGALAGVELFLTVRDAGERPL